MRLDPDEGELTMTTTLKPSTVDSIQQHSSAFLFFGIALLVLGIVSVLAASLFTISSVVLFGGLLVAAGIAETIHAFRLRHRGARRVLFTALSAIIYLIAGGVTLFNPVVGALSFTLVIGVFLIAAGLVRLIYGLTHKDEVPWGWFLFGGLIDISLGFLILLGWPLTGFWVIGILIGVEMITYGIATIALAARLLALDVSS